MTIHSTTSKTMKPFPFITVCVLACCLTAPVSGQDTTLSTQQKSAKRKANIAEVSEQRKEQLLSFVSENHAQLNDLLSKLEKRKNQRQYRKAMASLDKSVKKIEAIKERNPQRYESALQQWKLESRIKVTAAQYKLNESDESRVSLESFVTQLVDFHIARMKSDREKVQKRLEQLDKRIAEAESNREQTIEKRIKSATRKPKKVIKKD